MSHKQKGVLVEIGNLAVSLSRESVRAYCSGTMSVARSFIRFPKVFDTTNRGLVAISTGIGPGSSPASHPADSGELTRNRCLLAD